MKTLDEQMAVYAAYHRNRWNRITHFAGVPAIVFAILIPMCWVPLGDGLTLAHLFVAAVLAYYFLLDVPLAIATAVPTCALFYAAKLAAATGFAPGWIWSGAFFAGGWVFQLAGHVFEGRKPALADNLFQIFIAPIFLVAELFFALGLMREVRAKVEARLAGGAR
ncbi:MAG TPA: Mpo1-like protein [Burkholderiales bacterium]|nr:Mpo1-like protein [Burkholderiales bacterium]